MCVASLEGEPHSFPHSGHWWERLESTLLLLLLVRTASLGSGLMSLCVCACVCVCVCDCNISISSTQHHVVHDITLF